MALRKFDAPSAGVTAAVALALAAPVAAQPTLERVVIVERHGVRAPTQDNAALDALSAKPWPVWSVGPGILTPHGAEGVALMGAALRKVYADQGLLPATGCPEAGAVAVVADGHDQRTRESARAFVRGLADGCGIKVVDTAEGDPLFGSVAIDALNAAEADKAVAALAPVDTPASRAALDALQATVAPDGCVSHKGVCLDGASTVSAKANAVRVQGPLATGATLAENLLLEYAEGMPLDQVGWGKVRGAADIARVMPAHSRLSDLTRRFPMSARLRGAGLALAVNDRLDGPYSDGKARMFVFAGHDTNLANLAGTFGLSWTLKDQPDETAPATALAFEVWGDRAAGTRTVKVVVFYETLDQLRTLEPKTVSRTEATLDCAKAPICLAKRF
jgi:4-phytase/acid phosphatase